MSRVRENRTQDAGEEDQPVAAAVRAVTACVPRGVVVVLASQPEWVHAKVAGAFAGTAWRLLPRSCY